MGHFVLFGVFIALSAVASATVPIGTVALYSDGRVEKLVAIEENGLRWEDDRMRQFLRSRNPIMPILESRQRVTGKVYFQELKSGDPRQIRDLPIGTPLHFSVTRVRDGGAQTRYWRCEFLGDVRDSVLGKAQDLERYRCQRSSLSFGKMMGLRTRDIRNFIYSPDLGVIVRMERTNVKLQRTRTRKLIALFEPGVDYRTLSRAVRKARKD